ncbi:proton channel OTOP2 isoform X2 [Thalassophryne amazonica]|nr:proton channel OTOP2 isoform X2 [Thalassophryne amazonica]
MMAKDKEMEEAHLSNAASGSDQAETSSVSNLKLSQIDVPTKHRGNWGWMVSALICLNVLILGCTLVSGSAYSNINITNTDLQVFLIILILLTAIWMVFYAIYVSKTEDAVLFKDSHAGPIWLRGGLVLFGLLSVIMDIFKIASYVGYLHCDSGVKVAFPVVHVVFIIVQTYFLWVHAKDCAQLLRNLTCCGLMLTLSTNLVLWMAAVTEESLHQTIIPDDPLHPSNSTKFTGRAKYITKTTYGDSKCICSHTSCSIFKDAYYYLYPFNIEYSLFASTMAYVMWKNVGRVTNHHGHNIAFRLKDVFLGPAAGMLLVIAGLVTFIVYEVDMKTYNDKRRDKVVMMHFVMNIVIVVLMSIATVMGCVIYKLDHREHVSEKDPTRNLDVGLLVGASLGQFVISYFTIVAMVATEAKGYLNGLDLAWAIFMVIQLGLQNFFIIEGMHREPHHEVHPLVVVQNPYVIEPSKDLCSLEGGDSRDPKSSPKVSEHDPPLHNTEHRYKLAWKRRVLKEVCSFLLLGNIILWIMPAFGARPQFDYDAETDFFTFDIWAAVVNVGLPFGIFYRMHSVASLFEVFVKS